MRNTDIIEAIEGVNQRYISSADPVRKSGVQYNRVIRRIKKSLVAAAVVILLAMLSVTICAAVTYDLGFYLSTRFGGDTEMLNSITAIPQNVRYESSCDDVKLSVVGMTGDRNHIYVWLNAELPEDITNIYGDDFALGFDKFKVYGIDNSYCLKNIFVLGKTDNNQYALGILISQGDGATLIGRRVKIHIENINILTGDSKDSISVAEGEWNAYFSLNVPDLFRTYTPDISGSVVKTPNNPEDAEWEHVHDSGIPYINEFTVEDCRVDMSPMSITIHFSYHTPISHLFEGSSYITLLSADGGETKVRLYSSSGEYNNKSEQGIKEVCAVFNKPTAPESIVAVRYGNITVPLEAQP